MPKRSLWRVAQFDSLRLQTDQDRGLHRRDEDDDQDPPASIVSGASHHATRASANPSPRHLNDGVDNAPHNFEPFPSTPNIFGNPLDALPETQQYVSCLDQLGEGSTAVPGCEFRSTSCATTTASAQKGGGAAGARMPAAICRKVMVRDGGEIGIWDNGHQTRSFLAIDECVEGTVRSSAPRSSGR